MYRAEGPERVAKPPTPHTREKQVRTRSGGERHALAYYQQTLHMLTPPGKTERSLSSSGSPQSVLRQEPVINSLLARVPALGGKEQTLRAMSLTSGLEQSLTLP